METLAAADSPSMEGPLLLPQANRRKESLIRYSIVLLLAAVAAAPHKGSAQQTPSLTLVATSADSSPSAEPLASTAASPVAAERPLTARWLELTAFSHSERYRNQYGNDGYHYFEDGQQRSLIAGKVKLDRAGKLSIGFRASSGRSFNWAYADYAGRGFSGSLNNPVQIASYYNNPAVSDAFLGDRAGVNFLENLNSAGWEFYVRELYLSARPVNHVTVEFGSFGIEKGLSTEITSFDDDGYIAGERVRVDDPKHLFFDQITLTSAYFGYFDQPNLFARGAGFSKSNYRQVVGKKQLSQRVGISGECNWISNNVRTSTTREAIVVKVPESRMLDSFRLEAYEMNSHVTLEGDNEARRQGFALVGEKKLGKASGDFGFASIDRDYGIYTGSSFVQEIGFSLNGDTYNTGIRIFSHLSYRISPVLTASGFYTRFTGTAFNNPNFNYLSNINSQGLNAGLSLDLKALANTRKRIF